MFYTIYLMQRCRLCFVGSAFQMQRGPAGPFLEMSSDLQTASIATRSDVINTSMVQLKAAGVISRWYGELFPVSLEFGEEPIFLLERAAYNIIGVKGW